MKHRIYRHKPVLFCLILLFLLSDVFLTGCSRRTEPQTETGFYFNTVISITVYHPKDAVYLENCFSLCDTYEKMLGRTVEGSDIYRINHSSGEPVAVSEETARLLEQACNYARLSGGKIDPTVAPLDDLWNFSGQAGTESAQKRIPADALINLGGNVVVLGSKPDGSPFTIGMQKPFDEHGKAIATLSLSDSSLVSSGVYERYFRQDGRLYHHILDPASGYPVENGLLGVTILSGSSMEGDALSTTCFVLGLTEGMKLIESLPDIEAVFITEDYQLHPSSGLSGILFEATS